TLARELALNIADKLESGLLGRRHRLDSLRTRQRHGVALKQWARRKDRRRMRSLLHEEGIGDDRKDRKRRHDSAHELARMARNRSREPSGVKCGALSTGGPSRHFSSPRCWRSLQFPDHAREQT